MELQTYKIPQENWNGFQAKIEKLNKKASKLGCAPISFEFKESTEEEKIDGIRVKKVYYLVTVFGEAPKFSGWTFVAKLEPAGEKHLIRAVPGQEVPVEYREFNSTCEHCNQNRYRKLYYLVRNEDGEHKKVGSSCLKDFLGHKSPNQIAAWMEFIFDPQLGEFEGGSSSGEYSFFIEDVLAVAERVMRKTGYRKASEYSEETSTADDVRFYLVPGYTKEERELKREFRDKNPLDDKSEETAKNVREWMLAFDDNENDYKHNLKVCAEDNEVTYSRIGLVASAVWVYQKEVEKREAIKKERENKSNEYLSEVGKREDFDLTFVSSRWFHSQYSDNGTYLLTFEDSAGNALIWFTSAVNDNDEGLNWKGLTLEKGSPVALKGTVKGYKEYQGRKQTVLTRCSPR